MDTPPASSFVRTWQRRLASPRVWYYVFHRTTRYVVAWLVAVISVTAVFISAWYSFDRPKRNDSRPPWITRDDIFPDRLAEGALPAFATSTVGTMGAPLGQGPFLVAFTL